jgi:hypothetical protein
MIGTPCPYATDEIASISSRHGELAQDVGRIGLSIAIDDAEPVAVGSLGTSTDGGGLANVAIQADDTMRFAQAHQHLAASVCRSIVDPYHIPWLR